MTLHTIRLIEENQGAALLRVSHRSALAPSESVDRRIHERDRKFKLRDSLAEHRERNCLVVLKFRERLLESRAIRFIGVQPTQEDIADRFIAKLIEAAVGAHNARWGWQRHAGAADRRDIELAEVGLAAALR